MAISDHGKKLRFERAEQLRQQLEGEKYIAELDECAHGIREIVKHISIKETAAQKRESVAKRKERRLQETHELNKVSTKLKAINSLVDLNMKRLAKLVPDLRSTELTSPDDGNGLFDNFAKAVNDFENVVKSTKAKKKRSSNSK